MESNGRGTELKGKDDGENSKVGHSSIIRIDYRTANISDCEGDHEEHHQREERQG